MIYVVSTLNPDWLVNKKYIVWIDEGKSKSLKRLVEYFKGKNQVKVIGNPQYWTGIKREMLEWLNLGEILKHIIPGVKGVVPQEGDYILWLTTQIWDREVRGVWILIQITEVEEFDLNEIIIQN